VLGLLALTPGAMGFARRRTGRADPGDHRVGDGDLLLNGPAIHQGRRGAAACQPGSRGHARGGTADGARTAEAPPVAVVGVRVAAARACV
jgi:hypothetical protein